MKKEKCIISDRSSWNDPFVSIIWGIEVLDAGYDYEKIEAVSCADLKKFKTSKTAKKSAASKKSTSVKKSAASKKN